MMLTCIQSEIKYRIYNDLNSTAMQVVDILLLVLECRKYPMANIPVLIINTFIQ